MVDTVSIKVISGASYLAITFNSDAGKEEIDIPLTDIFNPSNYYTKAEIDAIESAQDVKINTISGNVNTLETKINTISGSVTSITADLSNYYTKNEVNASQAEQDAKISALSGQVSTISASTENKQDKLVAGEGISIISNVISYTGSTGGTVDAYTKAESDARYAQIYNTYNKNEVNNLLNNKIWCGTQAQYDAIISKDPYVLYLIHE